MRGSNFVFDCVHLLYYKCHKINLDCGESYVNFSDWIKSKKPTITPIDENDYKCVQYAVTVALLPSNLSQIIGQDKFAHSPLERNFEKQK